MGAIKNATDIYLTYRFIRALVTPFNKTAAFDLGIIDADGTPLKRRRDLRTTQEKDAYTIYDRLVFKLKRLLGKIPGGKSRLASFAAALWLIKEHVLDNNDQNLYLIENEIMDKAGITQDDMDPLLESAPAQIVPGQYILCNEEVSEVFDDVNKGDAIIVESGQPIDCIMGVVLFEVKHIKTGERLVVSHEGILPIYN